MPAPAKRAGRGPCRFCREPVTYKVSAGGLLNFKCDGCQGSAYAPPRTKLFRDWMAEVTPFPEDEADQPAPIAQPKQPAPASLPQRSAFDLGQLGA